VLGKILNFGPKIVEKVRFLMFFGPFLIKISALIYSAACSEQKTFLTEETKTVSSHTYAKLTNNRDGA